jgi:adenylate kinase
MRNRSRTLVVILFGPPGSGKSTQAALAERSFGLAHISPGDMLRTHMAAGSALGSRVAAVMRAGGLAPDEIINCMIADRIAEPDCANGFVLDGYPRTRNQTEVLINVLQQRNCDPVVIRLTLDPKVAAARLFGRQECRVCGALSHRVTRPPKAAGICDSDGSELTVRVDDSEDAIRARLSVYEAETEPARKLLSDAGYACKSVSNDAQPPEVTASEIAEWLRGTRMRDRRPASPAIL